MDGVKPDKESCPKHAKFDPADSNVGMGKVEISV